ncbi:hypothetical protein ABT341_00085 [Pseudonocardia alni]|uniref:hypothetical protein n=1 Tax=Pseudonocardia alni TaxID=33907 RepID=UPI00332B5ABC
MTDENDAMDELVRLSAELGLYDLDVRPCTCGRAQPCRHCEEGEDSLVEAVALHREANDSGRRYSLDEVAEQSGIDLDELRVEIAEDSRD